MFLLKKQKQWKTVILKYKINLYTGRAKLVNKQLYVVPLTVHTLRPCYTKYYIIISNI